MHLQNSAELNFNPQESEVNGYGHPQHCGTKHLNQQHHQQFCHHPKLFCLSYFTSFIGFYWQRDLNFSKRHLLVVLAFGPASVAFLA